MWRPPNWDSANKHLALPGEDGSFEVGTVKLERRDEGEVHIYLATPKEEEERTKERKEEKEEREGRRE